MDVVVAEALRNSRYVIAGDDWIRELARVRAPDELGRHSALGHGRARNPGRVPLSDSGIGSGLLRRWATQALLLLGPSVAAAQAGPATAAPSPQMIAALDSAMNAGMRRDRIPGGAYVLLSNGKIVASRGFGVADVSTRRRVNPDSTVFGLASTTKLFTSIAAARLAREGDLDLDGPVAPYLAKTPLSERLDGVTVSRLLTHTAGLDDPAIGSSAKSARNLLPLESYVARSITEPWLTP